MSTNRLTSEPQLALEAFLLDGQARSLSPRTLKFYREQLNWFFQYTGTAGVDTLADITPHLIRSYLVHLCEQKWVPASQHAAARAIRAFLSFCVADEWLDASPMRRVRMPKVVENILPAFELDDITRLVASVDTQRDRAILLCLLDSGCRAGEFLAWDVGDVNITSGTVRVRKTKNGKERTVFVGSRARRELLKLYRDQSMAPESPVWRNHNDGRRLGISGLQIMLRKTGEKAGVHPCNPHRFRRTFALSALRNGMNVIVLQKIMGHSDLTTLRRYRAVVDSDLQDAHQRFGGVDHLR